MKTASLYKDLEYNTEKPVIDVMIDTDFTKEIRIAMKQGTVMKKHQTPFPIVVELVDGNLDFGVNEEVFHLIKGDLIALDGGTPHDLSAKSDSIIRLTLTKSDGVKRVEKVITS